MPDKVIDVTNMFLMRFRSQNALEEPAPIVNLTDVPHLFEASDGLPHYWKFLWAISYVLDGDGRRITRIDYTLVILDRHPYPSIVEHRPIFLNKGVDPGLEGIIEMG